jgi:hypothetical protein
MEFTKEELEALAKAGIPLESIQHLLDKKVKKERIAKDVNIAHLQYILIRQEVCHLCGDSMTRYFLMSQWKKTDTLKSSRITPGYPGFDTYAKRQQTTYVKTCCLCFDNLTQKTPEELADMLIQSRIAK